MRYCVNCGAMNDTDAKYCSGCGKKFESAPTGENTQTDYTTGQTETSYRQDSYTNNAEQTGYSQNTSYRSDNQTFYGAGQSYNQSAYNAGAGISESKFNGYSVASMILGICSIIFSFFIPILPFVAAIVGLVLGNKVKAYGDNGMAKAGRITSIIGIVLFGVFIVLVIIFTVGLSAAIVSNPDAINNLYDFIEQYGNIY